MKRSPLLYLCLGPAKDLPLTHGSPSNSGTRVFQTRGANRRKAKRRESGARIFDSSSSAIGLIRCAVINHRLASNLAVVVTNVHRIVCQGGSREDLHLRPVLLFHYYYCRYFSQVRSLFTARSHRETRSRTRITFVLVVAAAVNLCG